MTIPVTQPDQNLPANVRLVEISREPIELYKILKFEGLVRNGGEAKGVIAAGQVLVNGKVETQKRKKIVGGDTIEFNKIKVGIVLVATAATEVPAAKITTDPIVSKSTIEGTNSGSVAIDAEIE